MRRLNASFWGVMHAIYLFRASTDNIDEVITAFELWIEEVGDDNNYFELLCALNSKGERRLLATKGDWRGRDEVAEELLRTIYPSSDATPEEIASHLKGEATLNDFKEFAWELCEYEICSLYTTIIKSADKIKIKGKCLGEFGDKKDRAQNFIARFTELVKEVERELGRSISVTDDLLLSYQVRKLFELYENLKHAKNLPFIENGNPYEYRCFDLDGFINEKAGQETILAVDIHT